MVEVKNEQTIYMTLTSSHFKNKYFLVFIFYFKLKVSILKVLNEDNFLVFLLNIPHVLPTDLKENTTTRGTTVAKEGKTARQSQCGSKCVKK